MDDNSGDWSEDEFYQNLLASFTASVADVDMETDGGGGFNTSDNEPLHLLTTTCPKTTLADTGFVTSDNEPLSKYACNQYDKSSGTDSDPTYHPEDLPHLQSSVKRRRLSRRDRNVTKAMAESSREAGRVSSDTDVHRRHLDNLLHANGLQRVEVAADGNCFFRACAIELSTNAQDLRKYICDYLEDNVNMFVEFLTFTRDERERHIQYMQDVAELRHPGRWNNNAGDMLPLALATWTNRIVRLYSSDPARPVLDINPVGGTHGKQNVTPVLTLALLEYPNSPHYNACTALITGKKQSTILPLSSSLLSSCDQQPPMQQSAMQHLPLPQSQSPMQQSQSPVQQSQSPVQQSQSPVQQSQSPMQQSQSPMQQSQSPVQQSQSPVQQSQSPMQQSQSPMQQSQSPVQQSQSPVQQSQSPVQQSQSPVQQSQSPVQQSQSPVQQSQSPVQQSQSPMQQSQSPMQQSQSPMQQSQSPVQQSQSPMQQSQSPMQQSQSPVQQSQSPLQQPVPSTMQPLFGPQSPPPLCQTPPDEQPLLESPRKQGYYETPPKKVLTRKKVPHPETWKRNVRKQLRLEGKSHFTDKGNILPAKSMKVVDCSKCRMKCGRLQDRRDDLFHAFYSLNSYEKQKHFVATHVMEQNTKTMHNDETNEPYAKKRNVSRQFFFTMQGQRERVCRKFFLSTLAISQNYLDHTLKNSESGIYVGMENRGRKRPHNKTPDQALERVKTHISSFPVVPSHYTRKDTQRKYLSPELNITKMHELYTEECQKEKTEPVSSRQYRKIFNENFNLSFHVPKKDQCSTCTIHAIKKAEGTLTETEQQSFQQHQRRKEQARREKEADKNTALKDPSKHVITVDLQAVLQAPCTNVSQLYYKRKLCVYNFTVYSLADGKGTCYIWDETEGKRGSCEIATCIMMYLRSLPRTVKEVTIFSDCCGGQNRNQNLTAALIHAVNNIPNIEIINQKYLETGHTQMECDSMHAAISNAKKTTDVFVPSEYDIVIRFARKQKQYVVVPMKYRSFYDFKLLASSFIRNTKTDMDGRKVNWLHIKYMQLCKGLEDVMFFKTSFDGDFRTLRLTGSSKRSRPAPPKTLPFRYNAKLPISKAKHQDLLSLCSSKIIPSHHHHFFRSLPVSSSLNDKLLEQAVNNTAGSETE